LTEPATAKPQAAARDTSARPNSKDQVNTTDRASANDRAARRVVEAVRVARRELQRLSQLGETLDAPVSPATAIELITAKLLEKRIADEPLDDAIQISGWLDLAMDESLAMVVVGFNHPFVPDSVTADPFLPGSLRGRLRMNDNERRLARDTYAAQLILATRPQTRLIVGRRAADGSPTPPSRLLAASAPEDLSRRLIALLDPQATNRRRSEAIPIPRAWEHPLTKTGLPVPSLPPLAQPITSMSVTSFSAYLACPYRFYLRHVLKLDPFDDAQRELAANQFGDMIHQALEWFGHSSGKDETRVGRIEDELIDALDRYAKQHFGPSPSPAVRLQVEQARRRLRHVARVQAERRKEGWQIVKVEDSVGSHNNAGIEVDGRRMTIRGRFDRVDRHEQTGDWAILDYKSHGHIPRKKHLQKVGRDQYRWIDLQLPIYRLMIPYLVGESVDPDRVRLGYFNIGDKETDTRINEADFKPEEFRQAEEVIKDCIRRIWQGDFRPSSDPVLYDDYAMILQSDTAAPWLEPEETAAEG
jgi:RecB family exonuclease